MMADIRHALRSFARTPALTAAALLTLALGIGVTTAMFSVVDAVMFEPLPYPSPSRLVTTRGSLPDLRDLRDASRSFDEVAIWATNLYNLRRNGESRQVRGVAVSDNLLPLLGVRTVLGQGFAPDDPPGDTVVLGHAFWQRQFGGDPSVIGRSIELSGTHYTVAGVAPPWFRFPSAEYDLWTRLATLETLAPAQARNRALRIFAAVARLRDGVTVAQAQSEADAVSARLAQAYPATNEGVVLRMLPLHEALVGDVGPALKMLLWTVALLLLIACANVANLMLARTTGRQREMAVRVALGAGRGRLVRQLATESLTLAAMGGLLGLLLALWGVDLLPQVLEARLPRADGIRIDRDVLAFAFGATLLTGLLFGLAPALQAATPSAQALKESGRAVTGNVRGRAIRRVIVVGEIALAVVVIVAAGLLVRSFGALTARDVGFDPRNLVTFNVQLVSLGDDGARRGFASRLLERIDALPGIEAAGGATGFAAVTPQRGTRFALDGRPLSPDEDGALFIAATPGYFAALRTRVTGGRAIEITDRAAAEPVAVVNRAFAERLFPGEDPVGRRLRLINPEQSDAWRTIVGVVEDVQYRGLGEPMVPTIYTAFDQTPFMWLYVMVRPSGSPEALLSSLRSIVPSVEPTLAAADLRLMNDVVAVSAAAPRTTMLLVSGFALLALVLAAVGIYGVMSYSVAQRTHEIGVRMALGARTGDVVRLVLREGAALAVAGILLGIAGAAAFSRILRTLLFGVTERDPAAFALGALLLLAVALVACYLPARRALRVDPMTALRAE